MTKEQWLSQFEEAVSLLLVRWYKKWESNELGLHPATMRFFTSHISMRDAMWTIAHFSYGRREIFDPPQAAAIWFNECVLPILQKEKKDEHERLSV